MRSSQDNVRSRPSLYADLLDLQRFVFGAVLTLSPLNSSAFGMLCSSTLKPANKFKHLIIFDIFYSLGLNCFPAFALTTYTLNYSSDNASNSLSGLLTIEETNPLAQDRFVSFLPSFVNSLIYTETVGATQTTTSLANGDYDYIYWVPKQAQALVFTQDLVPQMIGLTFFSSNTSTNPLTASSSLRMRNINDGTRYTLNSALPSAAAVPAPLPILGLPAVLFYSRKLKKRIKVSRELSSNALV